ncbi:MAG: S8 family serine peptidase, partial [Schleiferiaceae bacterium]|nr:S8 family serine peptidase [Schleiferiaceae bacterium]
MFKKIILCLILPILCSNFSFAQETKRYWVYVDEPILERLGITTLSIPALSQRSLDRRSRQNIPLRSFDYSMPKFLHDMVESTGSDVRFFSRWLRAFSVEASNDEYELLRKKKWIKKITPVQKMFRKKLQQGDISYGFSYGQSLGQTDQINLAPIHDLGFAGQGVFIALMDGGFSGVETHSVFQSAWNQGRILLTKDFVDGDTNVFHVGSHGMSVLSTICADLNGTFVGTAPEASYALFRTENELSETIAEEDNWVWASEWADSIGVDITNTSLG